MAKRKFERPCPDQALILNDPQKSQNPQGPRGPRDPGSSASRSPLTALCENIRKRRVALGLEQKELAGRIGVTANAISNWERGRARPDINLLPDICSALGISLYRLYSLEEPSSIQTEAETAHLEEYRKLDDGHRAAVDALIGKLLAAQETGKRRKLKKLINCDHALSAGIGDPSEFEERGEPIFVYADKVTERADLVFRVSGDSMEPEFKNGCRVLVQRIPDGPRLQCGEIGAFTFGNEAYIKEYQTDGLHSLNPAYSVLKFTGPDPVYLVGRIVGVLDEADIATPAEAERCLRLNT